MPEQTLESRVEQIEQDIENIIKQMSLLLSALKETKEILSIITGGK